MTEFVSHYFVSGGRELHPELTYRRNLSVIRVASQRVPNATTPGRITSFLDAVHMPPDAYQSAVILLADKPYLTQMAEDRGLAYSKGVFIDDITYVQQRDGIETAMNPVVIINAMLERQKAKYALLHELGHFVRQVSGKDTEEVKYHDESHWEAIRSRAINAFIESLATLISAVPIESAYHGPYAVVTVLSGASAMGAAYVASAPSYFSWIAHREERAAELFAWKHRKADILHDPH